MDLEKIYKDIINKLFPTLIEEKRSNLITLLLANHLNNIDEYNSGNVSTKFIIDNINIININDLLNYNFDELLNCKNDINLKKMYCI